LLGLPGGFLQYGEPPGDAVRREVLEEVLIDVELDRVLDSYLVDYEYRGERVSVIEVVFLSRPVDYDVRTIRSSEASSVGYYDVSEILDTASRLAFPEQQQSLRRYTEHLMLSEAPCHSRSIHSPFQK
jgi:ADP-ribose pyrophosphatase YjhB (NUDIX family)